MVSTPKKNGADVQTRAISVTQECPPPVHVLSDAIWRLHSVLICAYVPTEQKLSRAFSAAYGFSQMSFAKLLLYASLPMRNFSQFTAVDVQPCCNHSDNHQNHYEEVRQP